MAPEVEERYSLKDGLPQNQINPKAIEFSRKYGHYPDKVILNLKYEYIGSKFFILFPATHAPAIKPLGNTDINGSIAQGYNVDIEYHDDEEVDDKTLICRGLAKTP